MEYKDKNKTKGEDGYKNTRGLDAIASLFGGMMGKAVNKKHERKERIEKSDTKDRD